MRFARVLAMTVCLAIVVGQVNDAIAVRQRTAGMTFKSSRHTCVLRFNSMNVNKEVITG